MKELDEVGDKGKKDVKGEEEEEDEENGDGVVWVPGSDGRMRFSEPIEKPVLRRVSRRTCKPDRR